MNLSDALQIGLVGGQFWFETDPHPAEEDRALAPSASIIHYVGTFGWKDQSSGCVLLHGGSGDWRHYCANLQTLARSWTILAPDLPGFGLSDDPAGEDLAAIVAPVVAFLRGVPWRDLTLVGFSFGALVAAAAALEARPSRLILISPAGFGAHIPEMAEARAFAAQVAKTEGVRAGLAANLQRIMLHRTHPFGEGPLLSLMEEMLRSTRAKPRKFTRHEKILDRLRLLDCPMRILFGAEDPYHASVMERRRQEITEACSAARIETIEGAAHWLMLERPEAFEAALQEDHEEENPRR